MITTIYMIYGYK